MDTQPDRVTVEASTVGGTTRAPPSKSYTHRAVLAAGYAHGATVKDALDSADTRATMRAVEAFGGRVTVGTDGHTGDGGGSGPETDAEADPDRAFPPAGDGTVTLDVAGFGGRPSVPDDVVDCANSGTTMRLTTACAALLDGAAVLTGDASLRSRPQGPLLDAVTQLGGRAESTRNNGQAPLIVGGPIEGGTATMPGDVSSQFVTALLMAGAVTSDGVAVDLTTELKSAPYVEITREVLAAFGVETERTADGFAVPGGQTYDAGGAYEVPGDFSAISYLAAAGALAGDSEDPVRVEGAHPSAQGDAAILDVLERMGAPVEWDREAGVVTVGPAALDGVTVDVGDTPDLLPTIAVLGAAADGATRIENCEHVRYKETDRVAAMAEGLARMGAVVEEEPDALTIRSGPSALHGATVDGRGDHRLVMAFAVAGLLAGDLTIEDASHVEVSFPGFFATLAGIGADVRRVD